MKVIGSDTEKDKLLVFMFENDEELQDLIKTLVNSEPKEGMRIITYVPKDVELSPAQFDAISLISGTDGLKLENVDKVLEESKEKFDQLKEKYK